MGRHTGYIWDKNAKQEGATVNQYCRHVRFINVRRKYEIIVCMRGEIAIKTRRNYFPQPDGPLGQPQ